MRHAHARSYLKRAIAICGVAQRLQRAEVPRARRLVERERRLDIRGPVPLDERLDQFLSEEPLDLAPLGHVLLRDTAVLRAE